MAGTAHLVRSPGAVAVCKLLIRGSCIAAAARISIAVMAAFCAPLVQRVAAAKLTQYRKFVIGTAFNVSRALPTFRLSVCACVLKHQAAPPTQFGQHVMAELLGPSPALSVIRLGISATATQTVSAVGAFIGIVLFDHTAALLPRPPLSTQFSTAVTDVLLLISTAHRQERQSIRELSWLDVYYFANISQTDWILWLLRQPAAPRLGAVQRMIAVSLCGFPVEECLIHRAKLSSALETARAQCGWRDLMCWQAVTDATSLSALIAARLWQLGALKARRAAQVEADAASTTAARTVRGRSFAMAFRVGAVGLFASAAPKAQSYFSDWSPRISAMMMSNRRFAVAVAKAPSYYASCAALVACAC